MSFWMPRLLAGLLALTGGAWLGFRLWPGMSASIFGVVLGVACAMLTLGVVDNLRGLRLLRWLRGSRQVQAPQNSGLWGELGYRVERSIRFVERDLANEKARLAQFLSAIEASPNGVLLIDTSQQIEWCNGVAADHFGLNPRRDMRQRVTNLVRAPAFVAYLQAGVFAEAVQFPAPDGRRVLSVLVRGYGDGMHLVLSQDVTERERSETMRRDFVANVSHEIRTPLTVVAGFIETMGQLPLTEVERKRVLMLMGQQTQRMQTLVSDLLVLAQLEGSPRPAADRWVSVDALLTRVEADANALSSGRHALSVGRAAGVTIAGSESELVSAIHNLVLNAIRYTPDGGSVEVAWRAESDGGASLEVVDSGPGIAREHLPRLTERFYRVDSSRSRDTGGTGLGLSIVKHVAQRHGAELDIESELGHGSTFRLRFPAHRIRTREALAMQ